MSIVDDFFERTYGKAQQLQIPPLIAEQLGQAGERIDALQQEAGAYITAVSGLSEAVETRAAAIAQTLINDPEQARLATVETLRRRAEKQARAEWDGARKQQAATLSSNATDVERLLAASEAMAQEIEPEALAVTEDEAKVLTEGQKLLLLEQRRGQQEMRQVRLLLEFKDAGPDELVSALEQAAAANDVTAELFLESRLTRALNAWTEPTLPAESGVSDAALDVALEQQRTARTQHQERRRRLADLRARRVTPDTTRTIADLRTRLHKATVVANGHSAELAISGNRSAEAINDLFEAARAQRRLAQTA